MSLKQPSQVHPEHDAPLPGNIEDWSEAQIEEWNALTDEKWRDEIRADDRRKERERREALANLRDPSTPETETVTLGQQDLVVKTNVNKHVEDTLGELAELEQDSDVSESLDAVRSRLPGVLAWFVTSPDEYATEELWTAYLEEYGVSEGLRALNTVAGPYLDGLEREKQARQFRGEQ